MFQVVKTDQAIQEIARHPTILLLRSLNLSKVAAPDGEGAVDCFAFLIEYEAPRDEVGLLIGFYMVEPNELLFYAHEQNPVDLEQSSEIEEEARQFVESMGFMMDDIQFQGMPVRKRDSIRAVLPFFYPDCDSYRAAFQEGLASRLDDEIVTQFSALLREISRSRRSGGSNEVGAEVAAFGRILSIY